MLEPLGQNLDVKINVQDRYLYWTAPAEPVVIKILFCNLMIYYDAATKRKILKRLHHKAVHHITVHS